MSESNRPHIGFTGLGLMGSAMVSRLQDLGYSVSVMGHRNRTPIEAAVARGASEVTTGQELAAVSDIVMLCLDTSASVESVIYGSTGIAAGLREGAIVIDFGTSLPDSTKKIGADLKASGAKYLDAPLGRTPAHAKEGKLNIMAAGEAEDYLEVELVLNDLAENVYHVGELGSGHTLKLINNFFGMTLATAMSEAFAMADLAGIPRDRLYDVMSAGPLHSAMMDFIKANAVDGISNKLAFSIANANKDLGYYASMADNLNAPSFIAPATRNALSQAVDNGYGDKDVPVMVDFIADVFSGNGTS